MFKTIREFVDLLCKLGISPNQFLICMLIHEKDVAGTIKYFEENKRNRFAVLDIDWLLNNGFLLRIDKRKETNYELDEFIVTAKFTEEFLVDEYDAGEELWNTYPSWMNFDGSRKSAKSVDKDELIEKYLKKINFSKKKHSAIIEVIKKYAEDNNGYATMGIQKFVSSEQWVELSKLQDSDKGDLIRDL